MSIDKDFDGKRFEEVQPNLEYVSREMTDDNEQVVIIKNVEDLPQGKKFVPEYFSELKTRIVEMPEEIYQVSGIKILGKRIKSLLFTTDIAIINNSNADSILVVYPFTPQLTIMEGITRVAPVPVFLGVGGGTTTGRRSADLAFHAEQMGAYGVVVNSPMDIKSIQKVSKRIDIPLIVTVSSGHEDYVSKLNAGADMLNVSAGANTAQVVREIRENVGPYVPIIATGGPSGESILKTIEAGANAISYTPPTSAEIFAELMVKYRKQF